MHNIDSVLLFENITMKISCCFGGYSVEKIVRTVIKQLRCEIRAKVVSFNIR